MASRALAPSEHRTDPLNAHRRGAEGAGPTVVVVGATGLVGSAVAARLVAEGFHVIGAGRDLNQRPLPLHVKPRELDLAAPTLSLDLSGVDAVVNCAGVFSSGGRDDTAANAAGAARLFEACASAGVRRVIHFSAIGVDRETPSAFSRSKQEAEQALMNSQLDWIILRPSVIVGAPAYGGSALFRGLAALPFFTPLADAGALQIVMLDDVVETVVRCLDPKRPGRVALDIAGPERLAFDEVVSRFRRWLGGAPQRRLSLPNPLLALGWKLGDLVALLGWRTPLRSDAAREMRRGAIGDPRAWMAYTGIVPVSLDDWLAEHPASVQERRFANLYFLKPLVFAVFALFWIGTGIIALGPGWENGMAVMRMGGVPPLLAALGIIGGALCDIVIGTGIAFRRTSRLALFGALGLSLVYVVLGTFLVPVLWADPLGPMMKIWPTLALNLVALAIVDDR